MKILVDSEVLPWGMAIAPTAKMFGTWSNTLAKKFEELVKSHANVSNRGFS